VTAAGSGRADDAIAGLLLLARAFPQRLAAQREHRWLQLRREKAPADLEGQTVLVIGVGAVGGQVARFARALAMRVIGVSRDPSRGSEAVDEMHTPAALTTLLPRAQWVVLACPYGADTRHLLDATALARLPRGAGIVNVVHGGLVDAVALTAALHSGQLGGAYFGAAAGTQPPADSPLRHQPNVLIAPAEVV
jgi:phosphoglycerate dehydrogenase-like enzyme